jgi:hypothetical protein
MIALWIILSVIVGVAARNRYARSFFAWAFISLVASPLLAFLLLFALGVKPGGVPARA